MPERERWIFTMQLPAGLANPGRFVARVLKHLLRTWGIRCSALEESAEVRRLRKLVESLAARVAAQSELLTRVTEEKTEQS